MEWSLLWKGLAAGDRNGGPVRLATLLQQSLDQGFHEERIFARYTDWVQNGGFDTGPTLYHVIKGVECGLSIPESVWRYHHCSSGSAGIGPAHRSAALLMHAKDEQLIDFAIREAKLTHWDPIAGKVSAASLLIAQYLWEGRDFESIATAIQHRFSEIDLSKKQRSRGGYAPAVLKTAWFFLVNSHSFFEALEESLSYAGSANYSPVLVGLWAACRYKEIPDVCLQHPMCPPDIHSIAVL